MTAEIVPFLYLLFIIAVTIGGLYTVKKNELSSDGLIAGGFFGFIFATIVALLASPISLKVVLILLLSGIFLSATLGAIIGPKSSSEKVSGLLSDAENGVYLVPLLQAE